MSIEFVSSFGMRGVVRIYEKDHPANLLYENHNVIVDTVRSLFARLMASSGEPLFGVWGLAIGAGHSSWTDPDTQPEGTASQTALWDEIRRKKCSYIRFVDSVDTLNPVSGFSLNVDFQTVLNATTDNIVRPIREMGLIGGGSTASSTVMASDSTPYWDPATKDPNSVTLLNYLTLPQTSLPAGISFIFSWAFAF